MPLVPDLAILPEPQRRLWPELARVPSQFVLYGGTAIALRFGHRVSVDFDFFSAEPFDPFELQRALARLGEGAVLQAAPNSFTVSLNRGGAIKLSFFGDLEGRVGDPETTSDGCATLASPLDLMGCKLKVILQRADSRDYRDIAMLLRSGVPLDRGLGAAAALFPPNFPIASSAKALTYFDDLADADLLVESDRKLLRETVDRLGETIPIVPIVARSLEDTPSDDGAGASTAGRPRLSR
jgi:hypothetical protein